MTIQVVNHSLLMGIVSCLAVCHIGCKQEMTTNKEQIDEIITLSEGEGMTLHGPHKIMAIVGNTTNSLGVVIRRGDSELMFIDIGMDTASVTTYNYTSDSQCIVVDKNGDGIPEQRLVISGNHMVKKQEMSDAIRWKDIQSKGSGSK